MGLVTVFWAELSSKLSHAYLGSKIYKERYRDSGIFAGDWHTSAKFIVLDVRTTVYLQMCLFFFFSYPFWFSAVLNSY